MSRVVHFELTGPEPEKLVDFYTRAFGWHFGPMEGLPDYLYITTGKPGTPGINGGLGRGEPIRSAYCCIDMPDLDVALKAAEENGGKLLMGRRAIPHVGWYATFEDPAGNRFGLMQEDPEAK
jgi:predicted enzyme related to lactoylglutathione lyase